MTLAFDLPLVADALRGTDDDQKILGVCGSHNVVGYTLIDLLACGVSEDGIFRVLTHAKMYVRSVCKLEPSGLTGMAVEYPHDLVYRVLDRVQLVDLPAEVKLVHEIPFLSEGAATPVDGMVKAATDNSGGPLLAQANLSACVSAKAVTR